MYRIIDSRCSGKTSRLMLLAKETGSIIACSNPSAMEQKSHAYGITGVRFISYGELFKPDVHSRDNIMIDEIENFVQYCIYNNKLIGYSLSNED
jgi:hypothetical protein